MADRPTLEITWTYDPVHRKVDGGDDSSTEFTSYGGSGDDCYPEATEPAGWGVECKLDLYWNNSTEPTSDAKTVVLVHSGAWAVNYDAAYASYGVYEGRRYGASVMRMADAFAEEGFLVAVVDYRQGLRDYQQFGGGILTLLANWFHCTQRWEADNVSPFNWPPGDTWVPDTGKPSPPAPECESLSDTSTVSGPALEQFDEVFSGSGTAGDDDDGAALDAVNDVQAAVAWLDGERNENSNTTFAGVDVDPGNIFLVGTSAGAFTALMANFEADSTGSQAVDGAVGFAGTNMVDAVGSAMLAIDDAERYDGDSTRELLSTSNAAPVQLQQYEYDFWAGGSRAGNFDFARQTYRFLRDRGYDIELRVRCGPGHTPKPQSASSFNQAFGAARAFLNNLDGGGSPTDTLYWGSNGVYEHFVKRIGQDMLESPLNVKFGLDQPGDFTADKVHPVGDFNGDGFDDIFWYGGNWFSTSLCDSFWFSQGDERGGVSETSSFARIDAYYDNATDTTTDPPAGDDFDNLHTSGVIRDITDDDPDIPPETRSPTAFAVGDFDGDDVDDIYWYRSGTSSDGMWYGKAYDDSAVYQKAQALTGSFTRYTTEVAQDGAYGQLAVGDFNGDGYDDIYFDDTSTGDDDVWYGSATQGTFTEVAVSDGPDGAWDLLVGNFDGDDNSGTPIADIYFSSASNTTGHVLYGRTGTSGDRFDEQNFTDTDNYEYAASGTLDSGDEWDVFFYDDSGDDWVFYGSTSRTTIFTQSKQGKNESSTDSLDGSFNFNVGDFNGDGRTDLYLHSTTGNEWYLRAKSSYGNNQGFEDFDVGNVVASDRAGIVGDFGQPPGTTPARDDILWHQTDDLKYEPTGGWPWCPCGF